MKEEILFTDELHSLIKKSVLLKKKYFVIRSDQHESKHKFWLSGNHNIDCDIFSIKDINSYWNVLEVMEDR